MFEKTVGVVELAITLPLENWIQREHRANDDGFIEIGM